MIPQKFIVPEALIQGFKVLQRSGFVFVAVECVRVKALLSDDTVPVLVGRYNEKVDYPRMYMFFGDQAENDEGGVATYILHEALPTEENPVIELPKQTEEPKYVNWERNVFA